MSNNFEDLKWVRVFTPEHIPRYLVEQIKSRDYSVDDFYKYQELNCLLEEEKGPTLNPLNQLHVLVDKENMVKGFVWFTIETLSKNIILQTYSIDKEYWNKGKAVSKVAEFLTKALNEGKLKKIFWVTDYPKHSEKNGFTRSKSILMEYTDGQDTNRKPNTEECKPSIT